MKKKNLLVLVGFLLISYLSVYFFLNPKSNFINNKNEPQKHFEPYLETPAINTCTNTNSLLLELAYASNEDHVGSFNIGASNEKVTLENTNVRSIKSDNGSFVHYLTITLNVPSGEVQFDLNITINDKEHVIKDITNHNFDTKDIVPQSIIAKSNIHEISDSSPTTFVTEVTLDGKDVNEIEFGILSENIKEIEKIDRHSVNIVTETSTPTITGYYIVENNQKACINNVYHIYDLSNYNGEFDSAVEKR